MARLKSLQTEIETSLTRTRIIQRDYPEGSDEFNMLNEVAAYLEKAANAFSKKLEEEK